ncbi:hypothetical protein BJ508DRAFT_50055 [Ascobolus immersus RN42]|uniref:Uncharacterized protein n=1 Tax=Ascobolus immersus RN42 TaxID=1160509 RepID=A0A3N4HNN1_ASCIM|nr:hypothetical protein BJ508DRAFT_50055 [Ascobolus immersus RN42]
MPFQYPSPIRGSVQAPACQLEPSYASLQPAREGPNLSRYYYTDPNSKDFPPALFQGPSQNHNSLPEPLMVSTAQHAVHMALFGRHSLSTPQQPAAIGGARQAVHSMLYSQSKARAGSVQSRSPIRKTPTVKESSPVRKPLSPISTQIPQPAQFLLSSYNQPRRILVSRHLAQLSENVALHSVLFEQLALRVTKPATVPPVSPDPPPPVKPSDASEPKLKPPYAHAQAQASRSTPSGTSFGMGLLAGITSSTTVPTPIHADRTATDPSSSRHLTQE